MTKAFELAELANIANVDVLANTLTFNTALSLPSINASALTGTVPPSTLPQANSTSNGAVLILDSVANTSIAIYAASANSVKTAYDAAIAANTRASSAQTAATSAYSNATSYADTVAGTAYSNAVSTAATDASSKAATAYSNATTYADTKAATAYSNATAYADTKAATAYSNATSYSDTSAATAYTNAVAYAASNSYVNSTFLKLSGGTMTGSLTVSNTISVGNTTITGVANVTANLAANNATLRGSLQIDGNLYVSGTTVTINAVSLAVGDNMIYLNANSATANPDLGFAGNYNDGTYRHAGFFRDATDGVFKVFDQYVPEPDASAYIDTSNNTFRIADFQSNNTTLGTANVVGALAARSTATVNGAFTVSNTAALGNTTITGFANVTSTIQGGSSLTIAGALSGVTTAAMGNTTITGFANVSSTLQVGTNTATFGTAAYHVANGNFGLGTSSPGSKLDVQGSGSGVASFTSTSSSYPLKLVGSATTTAGYIGMSTDSMVFYVNSADRVLIDTSGNVGVGTNAPENKLTLIKNTTAATENSYAISIQSINTNAYTELLIGASDAVDAGIIQTAAKNTNFTGKNLALQPQGGSVGIGTTSPATGLDVYKAPDANWGSASFFDPTTTAAGVGGVITLGGYKIGTTNKSIFAKIQGAKENATSGNEAGYLAFITNNNSAYVERARFDSSGNFAIGRTTAGATLDIESSAGASTYWRRTTYANRGTFNVDGTNATVASEGALIFGAGSSFAERARIDSSGNFGIGLTNPSAFGLFTVSGSGVGVHINSTSGSGGISFYESGTGRFSLKTLNGSAGLMFYDSFNSAERARITSAGNFGIGTTTVGSRLTLYGNETGDQGITFLHLNSGNNTSAYPFLASVNGTTVSSSTYGWLFVNSSTNGNFELYRKSNSTTASAVLTATRNDGYVGIGTTSPTSTLDVFGLQTNTGIVSAATPTGTLRLAYAGAPAAGSFGSSIVFSQYWWNGSTTQIAVGQISGVKVDGDGTFGGGLAFFYGPSGANALTEGMRLTSTGLGIGTTSPATKLEVSGSAAVARVSGTAGTVPQLQLSSSGVVNWSLRSNNDSASDFTIYQDSTQRLKIDSSGNVGIGTSSPAVKVHVSGTGATTEVRIQGTDGTGTFNGLTIYSNNSKRLELYHNDNAGASYLTTNVSGGTAQALSVISGGNLSLTATGANIINLSTNGSERARIDSSGIFNIGLTNGSNAQLVVQAQTSYTGNVSFAARFNRYTYADTGSHTTLIGFGVEPAAWSKSAIGHIRTGAYDTGSLIFCVNGTADSSMVGLSHERMRIDSSGYVGIGTTSPSSSLHIVKGNGLIRLDNGDGNYSTWQQTGSDTRFGTQSAIPLAFYTNTTERARITSGGQFLIGTTTSSSEANLFLGAQGTVEGGQIVLQKGTSQTYATHLDNFTDSFRVMSGTDTGSTSVHLSIAHGTGYLTVSGVYSATVGGTNRDVYVDNSGLIGYVSSVRASKTNIVNLTDVSWLLDLVPVSFNRRKKDEQGSYTDETEGTTEYGLIAEETEAVKPELCFYDEVDGNQELRGISYSKLITPMLKLIQDQQDTIDELRSRVAQLEDKLN